MDPNLSNANDLLANFMNATDDDGVPLSDPKYTTWLRDMILSFVIAGRDTTACTLSWLLYELSQNPEVQVRVVLRSTHNIQCPTLCEPRRLKVPYKIDM